MLGCFATSQREARGGVMTPHPSAFRRHLFLPKTGPFCPLHGQFPRQTGESPQGEGFHLGANRRSGRAVLAPTVRLWFV